MELSLEVTFPVDPAAGVSIIFLSAQLQAVVYISLSGVMEQELDEEGLALEVLQNVPL